MSYRIMPTGEKFVKNIGVFLAQFLPKDPEFAGEILTLTFPENFNTWPVFKKGQRKETKNKFVPEIVFIAVPVRGQICQLEWVYKNYQLVKY